MFITVEAIVPESMRHEANHLAAAKGLSLADLLTFGSAMYEDADGNRYCWTGVQVSPSWLQGMTSPVEHPGFDADEEIDLVAAETCRQSMIVLQALPEQPVPITGLVVYVGTGLAGAYGLTRISEE